MTQNLTFHIKSQFIQYTKWNRVPAIHPELSAQFKLTTTLEADIAERLPDPVPHYEAGGALLNDPRRREAALLAGHAV
jgi:hypothetical protein